MRWQYHEKNSNIPNLGEGQREKGFENCSTYHWPSIFWIDEQSKRHYNGIKLDIKLDLMKIKEKMHSKIGRLSIGTNTSFWTKNFKIPIAIFT